MFPSSIPAIYNQVPSPFWGCENMLYEITCYISWSIQAKLTASFYLKLQRMCLLVSRILIFSPTFHQHSMSKQFVQISHSGIPVRVAMNHNEKSSLTGYRSLQVFLPALNWRRPGTNSFPWAVWTMLSRMLVPPVCNSATITVLFAAEGLLTCVKVVMKWNEIATTTQRQLWEFLTPFPMTIDSHMILHIGGAKMLHPKSQDFFLIGC